jgi:hypothetical protein
VMAHSTEGCRWERPPDAELEDTGLVIDDYAKELVHPCGKREPVPGWVIARCWLASIPCRDGPPMLKVYRQITKPAAAQNRPVSASVGTTKPPA